MSSSALLHNIQQQVLRIGGPILILIGSISCILNLMVFTKRTLRKNPCTICLIVVNVITFLYFYFGLLPTLLSVGYNIDPSTSSIVICRLRYYIAYVLACWQSSSLVLAAIDRTFITSHHANTRRLSTPRFVRISMLSIFLFWLLFQTHALVFTEIVQFAPGYFVCYYQPGLYTTLMSYQSLSIMGVVPPLLMSILGVWTVKNLRGLRRPASHSRAIGTGMIAVGPAHTLHARDQQLIRILLVDIVSFALCKLPATTVPIYLQITQSNEKGAEQQIIEQSVIQLTFFWYFLDNATGCFRNSLVSKTFRTELKRIFSNAFAFCCRRPG